MATTRDAKGQEPGLVLRLEVLPTAQRRLWEELDDTPPEFVLYGGTALALRLGPRQSRDFDFFSSEAFDPVRLLRDVPYLSDAQVLQQNSKTLTCEVDRQGPARISFFGALPLNRVEDPEAIRDRRIRMASLLDLAATKAHVVQVRASARDYLDLDALFRLTDATLPRALAAGQAVFGRRFNPLLTLKALTWFAEGDLSTIPEAVRGRLRAAVASVDPDRLPTLTSRAGLVSGYA